MSMAKLHSTDCGTDRWQMAKNQDTHLAFPVLAGSKEQLIHSENYLLQFGMAVSTNDS